MQGMIVMWSGAIVDIPDGWVLCDGDNGTPDLRNRFVLGAGDTYAVDDTGGADSHTHTGRLTSGSVSLFAGTSLIYSAPDGSYSVNGNVPDPSLYTYSLDHLPPYLALCFIMHL